MYFDDEIDMTYTFKKFQHVQIHQMYMIIFFIEIYETLLFSIVANTMLTYMTYTVFRTYRMKIILHLILYI